MEGEESTDVSFIHRFASSSKFPVCNDCIWCFHRHGRILVDAHSRTIDRKRCLAASCSNLIVDVLSTGECWTDCITFGTLPRMLCVCIDSTSSRTLPAKGCASNVPIQSSEQCLHLGSSLSSWIIDTFEVHSCSCLQSMVFFFSVQRLQSVDLQVFQKGRRIGKKKEHRFFTSLPFSWPLGWSCQVSLH